MCSTMEDSGFNFEPAKQRIKEYECIVCSHLLCQAMELPCSHMACQSCLWSWQQKPGSRYNVQIFNFLLFIFLFEEQYSNFYERLADFYNIFKRSRKNIRYTRIFYLFPMQPLCKPYDIISFFGTS